MLVADRKRPIRQWCHRQGSGAVGKASPQFRGQRAEKDDDLAADEQLQPPERRAGEAVAVRADAGHAG